MLVAINLNDKPVFAASEVREKGADGELARETMTAKLARFQFKPEQCLRLIA